MSVHTPAPAAGGNADSLAALAEHYGYRFFLVLEDRPSFGEATEIVLSHNWPDEAVFALSQLPEEILFAPVEQSRGRVEPFVWHAGRQLAASSGDGKPADWVFLAESALMEGLVVPCRDEDGNSGAILFSGRSGPLLPDFPASFRFAVAREFKKILRRSGQRESSGRKLSDFEAAVLYKVDQGASIAEIGRHFILTERTVQRVLDSICNKLGAVSTAHAVSLARHLGYFG